MKGFFCKALEINLTDRTSTIRHLDEAFLRATIGGKGLGTKLLLEYNQPGVDPLGPENHMIIASGPLAGSSLYGSSRYGIFAKSPLTHFYGESYSGGSFAIPLSQTGFDAVIIKGASTSPVWLEMTLEKVLFHDADRIWGKDTFDAEEYIKNHSNDKNCGVMVIGPAGENLVRFAVIKNDKHRVAGRTGMGAVLGSKKVKGILCYGDARREIHDPDGIKVYRKDMLRRLKNEKVTQAYRTMGTPMMVDILNNAGTFPTGYWNKGRFGKKDRINADAIAERLGPKPHACRDCFLACGKYVKVSHGRHKGLKLEGPEYETIYAFGGLCMIGEIEEIVYLNDLCDRLGLDTISSGNLAAFAVEASRKGKIKEKVEYGSADDVKNLLLKIVGRQGVGGVLAEGIKPASEELDMVDDAVHVKGMEPAGYDPRVLKGMGLAYAVSERGACHLRTTFYKPELAGIIDPAAIDGKAELFKDFEDRCTLFDSLILCRFFRDFYPWEELSKLYHLATGISLDQKELAGIAGHIKDMTRRFNLREGMTAAHDTLPKRFLENNLDDNKVITTKEIERLVSDYYAVRGWNADGIPPGE